MSRVRGYSAAALLLPLLLLVLLVDPVVSEYGYRLPQRRSVQVNEAPSPYLRPSISSSGVEEQQKDNVEVGASMQGLIARSERRRRSGRSLYVPTKLMASEAQHQQSTNSAAARRDRHFKQQRQRYQPPQRLYARSARGAGTDAATPATPATATDSTMIAGARRQPKENSRLPQKRNDAGKDKVATSASRQRREETKDNASAAVPTVPYSSNVVYLMQQQPESQPQPQPQKQQRKEEANVFELTNPLMKSVKDDDDDDDDYDVNKNENKVEDDDDGPTTAPVSNIQSNGGYKLPPKMPKVPPNDVNEGLTNSIAGYALYHQVADAEDDDNFGEFTGPSVATNLLIDELKKLEYTNDVEPIVNRFGDENEQKEEKEQPSGQYEYSYRVIDRKTSSDFGHVETRNGAVTSGHYHILLPDNRIQRVTYYADHTGYHADVSYVTNVGSTFQR